MDLHPRLLGVALRYGHGPLVDVAAEYGQLVVPLLVPGPLPGLGKDAAVQESPVLRGEAPIQEGALLLPIMAASMGMVPLPHMGSMKGVSGQ